MLKENITKIESGNAILSVKIYPKQNAETVILLHGGPGVPDEMMEVVQVLTQKYQVVNFEQRGVGGSACKDCDYSMEEYISDIDSIAKYLNLKYFHLLGHSWGGLYAQIYAEENPDKIKSLFLVSPASGTNADWEKTKKEVMSYNKKSTSGLGWAKMGIDSLLGMLGSSTAYRKLYKRVVGNYNKEYDGGTLSDKILKKINAEPINKTARQISKYPMLENHQSLEFPVMITYGDNDIYGESKKSVYDRFPMAEFFTIRDSGHIPWKHNSGEFMKIFKKFYEIN